MNRTLGCGKCGQKMIYTNEPIILTYNKKEYSVVSYFYKCNICGEEFTTSESDEQTLMQIPEYIKRHGL